MLLAVAIVVAWFAACVATARLAVPWLAARCGGDRLSGLLAAVVRGYCRVVHRVSFTGLDTLRREPCPGPLVVVANHTAGVDPLLVQSGVRWHVRWMMDRRMMAPALDWVWRHERLIPVDFAASDARSAIDAMRHVQAGGVLGLFPEGGIARPAATIGPFLPGAGLVVSRTGAPVVLCWISGTPTCERAFDSLWRRSRSRVAFLDVVRYPPRTPAVEICADLRRRLAEASGWPLRDATSVAPSPRGAVAAH